MINAVCSCLCPCPSPTVRVVNDPDGERDRLFSQALPMYLSPLEKIQFELRAKKEALRTLQQIEGEADFAYTQRKLRLRFEIAVLEDKERTLQASDSRWPCWPCK